MKRVYLVIIISVLFLYPTMIQARQTNKTNGRGFNWVLVEEHGLLEARTSGGKIIVPADEEFSSIELVSGRAPFDYFLVERSNRRGVYSINGEQLLAPSYVTIVYESGRGFVTTDVHGETEEHDIKPSYTPGQERYIAVASADDEEAVASQYANRSNLSVVPHAATTEILSIEEVEQPGHNVSHTQAFPQPLRTGRYNSELAFTDASSDAQNLESQIYYSSPTRTLGVVIPSRGIKVYWDDMRMKQLSSSTYDKSPALLYYNTDGDRVEIQDMDSDPNLLIISFTYRGNRYNLVAERSTFVELTPATVRSNLR